MKEGRVKVQLPIANSTEVETVWTEQLNEGYRVDNIPFYAKGIAVDDVVEAIPDADGFLRFVKLLHPSGHSTLRLWFSSKDDVERVREQLAGLGCSTEMDLSRLIAIDVPPSVNYHDVVVILKRLEEDGILEYEEGCIAHAQ